MSLARARIPLLARGISTTPVRRKKIGAPDKADRARIRQEQEGRNRERANAVRMARARGDDWIDTGYQSQGRIILDRKRGRHLFNPLPESARKAFKGPEPMFKAIMTFGEEQPQVGKPTVFPSGAKYPIDVFGVPRNIEHDFRLLSRPAAVTRRCTIDMIEFLQSLEEEGAEPVRRIITGPSGSGKSYTMLHAVHHAVQAGWIVVYIPRAIDLVKNISEYTYDRRTRTFFQPQAAREILQNMLEVNPNLRKTLTGNAYKHAEQGLGEPAEAPHALEAVLVNLGQQAETPVLIAVDEVQALYSTSWYRDPYFKPIEACHLSVPRLLLDFASGRKTIAKGAFLGTYTTTNTHFPLPLVLSEALEMEDTEPVGPWSSRPKHLQAYVNEELQGWPLRDNGVVTSREAMGMYELWQLAQAVPVSDTDRTFMNAYAASSGNARAFVKDGLLFAMEV